MTPEPAEAAGIDSADFARFRLDDPPELILSSFVCMYCLHEAREKHLVKVGEDWQMRCACERCGAAWSVRLRVEQAIRLFLYPLSSTAAAD
jgi:hypothetical protein